MLDDLRTVLNSCGTKPHDKGAYAEAIEVRNCLGKRSGRSRLITGRHLAALYGLDAAVPEFRGLLYFWRSDPMAHPLLALLCAYSNDPLLRLSSGFILELPIGSTITRETTEKFIDTELPDRFSAATRRSLAQNLNGSWTQSGHLTGRVQKIRMRVDPSPGAVAYALFLGHLNGIRGELLFDSAYTSLLDASEERLIELAEVASRRGWVNLKRIHNVIEVQFPSGITSSVREERQHESA